MKEEEKMLQPSTMNQPSPMNHQQSPNHQHQMNHQSPAAQSSQMKEPSLLKLLFPRLLTYEDILHLGPNAEEVRHYVYAHPRLKHRVEQMLLEQFPKADDETARRYLSNINAAAVLCRALEPSALTRLGLIQELRDEDIVAMLCYLALLEDEQLPGTRTYIKHLLALPEHVAVAYYRALRDRELRINFFHDFLTSRHSMLTYEPGAFNATPLLIEAMAKEPPELILDCLSVARQIYPHSNFAISDLLAAIFREHDPAELARIIGPSVTEWEKAHPLSDWTRSEQVLPELTCGNLHWRHNFLLGLFGIDSKDFDYQKGRELLRCLYDGGYLSFRRAYAALSEFPPAAPAERSEVSFCFHAIEQAKKGSEKARLLALAVLIDSELDRGENGFARHVELLISARISGAIIHMDWCEAIDNLRRYHHSRLNWETHTVLNFLIGPAIQNSERLQQIFNTAYHDTIGISGSPADLACALEQEIITWFWEDRKGNQYQC